MPERRLFQSLHKNAIMQQKRMHKSFHTNAINATSVHKNAIMPARRIHYCLNKSATMLENRTGVIRLYRKATLRQMASSSQALCYCGGHSYDQSLNNSAITSESQPLNKAVTIGATEKDRWCLKKNNAMLM